MAYRCLYPRRIYNHSRDCSDIYIIDDVPCGHCPNCLANRRDDWCTRLKEEVKAAVTAWAVTLTYDDAHLVVPKGKKLPVLCKEHPQKWIRALRDYYGHEYPIRYFIVGEYGSKSLRPHYHAMVFNLPWNYYQQASEMSLKFWPHCQEEGIHVDVVDEATIRYCSKYCLKRYDYDEDELPYMRPLMSKGIGAAYLSPDRVQFHRESLRSYLVQDGFKVNMPRYYKNKLFDDDMKERIAEVRQGLMLLKEKRNTEKDLQVQGWSRVRQPITIEQVDCTRVHKYSSKVISNENPNKSSDYRREIELQKAARLEKIKHLNNTL